MASSPHKVTKLLADYASGDSKAFEKLWPEIYAELRKMAHRRLQNERPGHTIQPTALVNEAYLRLSEGKEVRYKDRVHFFAIAANTMRRILIDYAKAKNAEKRGGGGVKVTLQEGILASPDGDSLELILLDEALKKLEREDERLVKVVELKYFGGMSIEEIANALEISEATVKRDWNVAKLWLLREISKNK